MSKKNLKKEIIYLSSDSDFEDEIIKENNKNKKNKIKKNNKKENEEKEDEEIKEIKRKENEISLEESRMIIEKAKSGRAECKKCGEKIQNKEIRVGIITEGDWGLFTR